MSQNLVDVSKWGEAEILELTLYGCSLLFCNHLMRFIWTVVDQYGCFICLFSRVIFNFYKLFTGKVSHYAQLPENKERDAFDFKMNLERKSYVATEKKKNKPHLHTCATDLSNSVVNTWDNTAVVGEKKKKKNYWQGNLSFYLLRVFT